LDLYLPMQSVPITTNITCVQIQFRRGVLDTTLGDKFLRVPRFPPS
jgi:hypothetical protein